MTAGAERARLDDDGAGWRRWGPYLSERAWGTVREDYSAGGDAWAFFPHDHARSRAYRWSEDGLGGVCDDRQLLCLAFALWNGRDPILKERPFGLTGPEGNHGEDAKDHWFYEDSTPTHSWMRWRYFYPQAEFPYDALVHHGRGFHDPTTCASACSSATPAPTMRRCTSSPRCGSATPGRGRSTTGARPSPPRPARRRRSSRRITPSGR
jgi:hypothetical protein